VSHVTVKEPETGQYIELCIPTYSECAYVIRASSQARIGLLPRAITVARASGAKYLVWINGLKLDSIPIGESRVMSVPIRRIA